MSIEDREIPEMSVDELVDYVEEDDIPTSEFTVEDTDRMVILGKLNAVLEWLKHHRGTDIYSNDEFLETYNIDLKLDKSVYDAFILSLDEILNDIADTLETIPTKTSELNNDSGYITLADIPSIPTKTSDLDNDSGFITLSDIPTIPTKTSELVNDSGFITNSYHDSTKQDTLTFDTTPTANSQNPVTSDGVYNALENKANKDLSNVTYPLNTAGSTTSGSGDRVIETYISSDGKTWYRKWASGWKECGVKIAKSSWNYYNIALPLTFANVNTMTIMTDWDRSISPYVSYNDMNSATIGISNYTVNSVNTALGGKHIYVCGY